MVVTLWVSRKARTVTKTEVSLGRQDEGFERFESTVLSQTIVRLVSSMLENTGRVCSRTAPPRRWRSDSTARSSGPRRWPDGTVPSFDLVRAAVNLMVASALISLATSFKLPLSTTYVTFMVAMGSSLSDQAWGRESAVYRVSGVLTVIGGWFFTAMMAFTVAFIFAIAIFFGRGPAVVAIIGLARVRDLPHPPRAPAPRESWRRRCEVFNLRKIKDCERPSVQVTFEHAGLFLREVHEVLDSAFDGLFEQDRQKLKEAKVRQTQDPAMVQHHRRQHLQGAAAAPVGGGREHPALRPDHQHASRRSRESLRDMVMRAHVHVANNHSGLLDEQIAELARVRTRDSGHSRTAHRRRCRTTSARTATIIEAMYHELQMLVHEFDQNQIMRIQNNASKTRLSILFYSFMWDSVKIAEQTVDLLAIFKESLSLRQAKGQGDMAKTEPEPQTPSES